MTDEKIVVRIEDEDVLELIPGYLQNRRADLAEMGVAVRQNDFETLRGLGHKMKGSGEGYGLVRVSEIGAKLESAAKAKDGPTVEQQITELQDYIDRVEVVGVGLQ